MRQIDSMRRRDSRPVTKAIVPAAGIGTRLYPITRSQPKEMLPLGRKPTIQWVVEELIGADLRSLLFITGENKRALEDHFDPAAGPFGESSRRHGGGELFDDEDLRILYIRQGGPHGLADAILCGDTFADGDDVVVALGDVVLMEERPGSLVRRLCEAHHERQAAATIAVNWVPDEDTQKYGIVALADDAAGDLLLRDVIEKPSPGQSPSNLAITGRYVLSPLVFDYIRSLEPGHGGEFQLTDALRAMLRDGLSVYAEPLGTDEQTLDIGDIPGYWRSFLYVALHDATLGEEMRRFADEALRE
ncbi:MAG: NTP transferase domain-containing protein [Armatimonadetes bacterium]|nr:NTP transferase domain-containing protein [Armatimonadota bacterium]